MLVVIGAAFAVNTHFFLQRAIPGKGTIVKLIERRSDDGDTLYAPVFTFTDAKGKSHKVFSSVASFPPIGDVGDEIDVLYDQNYPEEAKINRFFNLWGVSAVLSGGGAFEFVLSWIVAFFTKRKIKSANRAVEKTP